MIDLIDEALPKFFPPKCAWKCLPVKNPFKEIAGLDTTGTAANVLVEANSATKPRRAKGANRARSACEINVPIEASGASDAFAASHGIEMKVTTSFIRRPNGNFIES